MSKAQVTQMTACLADSCTWELGCFNRQCSKQSKLRRSARRAPVPRSGYIKALAQNEQRTNKEYRVPLDQHKKQYA
jgi:hypothetical protein